MQYGKCYGTFTVTILLPTRTLAVPTLLYTYTLRVLLPEVAYVWLTVCVVALAVLVRY